MSAVLVVTDDVVLRDAQVRLADAAGCPVRCVDLPGAARRWWQGAPLVLLDFASAAGCAAARLPRRDGVVVAVLGEPTDAIWGLAVGVGAEHVVSLPDAAGWLVATFGEAAVAGT